LGGWGMGGEVSAAVDGLTGIRKRGRGGGDAGEEGWEEGGGGDGVGAARRCGLVREWAARGVSNRRLSVRGWG